MTDKKDPTVPLDITKFANLIIDKVTAEMNNVYLEMLSQHDSECDPPISDDIDRMIRSLCSVAISACASTASLLGHEEVAEEIQNASEKKA